MNPRLKNKDYITTQDAMRVRYILHNTDKIDGRKLRIKKMQIINWFLMIYTMIMDKTIKNPTDKNKKAILQEMYNSIMKNENTMYNPKYIKYKNISLRGYEKKLFLEIVDNCFLFLMAELGTYINTAGTKIEHIGRIHPKHLNSIINKLKEKEYTLPPIFKPIELNIEE